ncbi:B12-binding domain-containing radical SAM protein [Geomonas sp. RF6]|uniref:B12-binding domain-containing radical SAM protein n=1 Tax=Geomonas sp. RF6 TaxID=2897342 RepID=UPI001E5B5AFA|nr:B12-binding domain-containing radical SAM protein [Geomonas sp. RF6]UFS71410.1 B12-binding domain-containing radical SAM protein [Geomonas sp. RF6]
MKIVLVTLHAKYVHASLALPCLAAACRDLEKVDCRIMELTVNEQQDRLLTRLVAAETDVILFSCYIWNMELTLKIASDLKQVAPETFVVLGGPEASYGAFEIMERNAGIDCIVRGEGEVTCRELLQALRDGTPLEGVEGITYREDGDIVANPERELIARLDTIPSPFAAGLVDLQKPLVYLETSRGCPFSCAFCMSAMQEGVRTFGMDRIKSDLRLLLEAGVPTVKFVDRTFNYDAVRSEEIWNFILKENRKSSFHFEIAAQLLNEPLLALLRQVPPDTFRFEIGVQSTGEDTLSRVGRRSDLEKLFANVQRLLQETAVTVHLDLVAGLPGETFPAFLGSLQKLIDLHPHHIQVEVLKVLKGTPMRGISREEKYRYSEAAPYKVLQTPWLTFQEIRRIEGISRLVDQLYNSERFAASLKVFGEAMPLAQFFAAAADFFEEEGNGGLISLSGLFDTLWRFGKEVLDDRQRERLQDALCFDYCLTGYPGGNLPSFFPSRPAQKKKVAAAEPARSGERVRYFQWTFERDYRETPWREEATELTFIYRSAPGEGLKVETAET